MPASVPPQPASVSRWNPPSHPLSGPLSRRLTRSRCGSADKVHQFLLCVYVRARAPRAADEDPGHAHGGLAAQVNQQRGFCCRRGQRPPCPMAKPVSSHPAPAFLPQYLRDDPEAPPPKFLSPTHAPRWDTLKEIASLYERDRSCVGTVRLPKRACSGAWPPAAHTRPRPRHRSTPVAGPRLSATDGRGHPAGLLELSTHWCLLNAAHCLF